MTQPTLISPAAATISSRSELCEALEVPFSDEQLDAITAPLEPSVVIAGAGSGKTTVMAARVVWLVGTGAVRPDQVLGLTFTRKAAAELAVRVRDALARSGMRGEGLDEGGEEVIMTYDAFAARLIADHGQRIGVESDPTLISGAARYRLAARVVASMDGPFEHLTRLRPLSVTERVLSLDADLAAHLVSLDQVRDQDRAFIANLAQAPFSNRGAPYASVRSAEAVARERTELLRFVASYRELKTSLGLVEFADQMSTAAELVDQVDHVAELVRAQFRVVLLDEYQDTSAAQVHVLRGLFSGSDPAGGRGHPVTAVGDPFQAIYGWRGAAASNILSFGSQFPRRDGSPARSFQLGTNRRSGPEILAAANRISAGLRADPALRSGDQALIPVPLVAPPSTPPATVRAAEFLTWPDEVEWVAEQVIAHHEGPTATRWRQLAVLCRRNADIGAVHSALVARDVPCEIVGLGGLLDLPEVADLVATLSVINDVTANPQVVQLLSGPRWRIGPEDLELLGRQARRLAGRPPHDEDRDLSAALDTAVADTDPSDAICLVEALDHLDEAGVSAAAAERLGAFAAELADLRRHDDEPVLDLVRRVERTLGISAELLASPDPHRERHLDQVAAFVDAVGSYVDVDGDSSLTGLLAWLDAERRFGAGLDQATPSAADSVKLLTVHRAKGLEWDVVFLPGLVNGVFPSDRVTDNWTKNSAVLPADLRGDAEAIPQLTDATNAGLATYADELKAAATLAEDRLAYVAVTRARREVVGSTHRWRPGNSRIKEPSQYARVIAEEAGVAPAAVDASSQNPLDGPQHVAAWPMQIDHEARRRRIEAAALVEQARHRSSGHGWTSIDQLSVDEAAQLSEWDRLIDALSEEVDERARRRGTVAMPTSLSASQLIAARSDPQAFARRVLRPMPRPVHPASVRGSRFHAWVESRAGRSSLVYPALIDPDDSPMPADPSGGSSTDTAEFEALQAAFLAGPWAQRLPVAVEVPFVLVLGDVQVRGRIDAVYPGDDGFAAVVVDWKTGSRPPDPWQLAIYRLAWAQAQGVAPEQVDAVFVHVLEGRDQRPERLATEDELRAFLNQ